MYAAEHDQVTSGRQTRSGSSTKYPANWGDTPGLLSAATPLRSQRNPPRRKAVDQWLNASLKSRTLATHPSIPADRPGPRMNRGGRCWGNPAKRGARARSSSAHLGGLDTRLGGHSHFSSRGGDAMSSTRQGRGKAPIFSEAQCKLIAARHDGSSEAVDALREAPQHHRRRLVGSIRSFSGGMNACPRICPRRRLVSACVVQGTTALQR
jgi:hypothetical protein